MLAAERWHPDLAGPESLPARLMRAVAMVLPVAGAAIGLHSGVDRAVPLGASDATAALAEGVQFTTGIGPA